MAAFPDLVLGEQKAPAPPALTFVFRVNALLGEPLSFGRTDGVEKRLVPITGGSVTGPKLVGEVLPGGADWQSIMSDGLTRIHAQYSIRTNDGALIAIDNPGVRRGPPEVLARMASGEIVDPRLYYFRTAPTFTVSAPRYGWMTRSLFICVGERRPNDVQIDYFELS